jgi:ribosomal protein S18 acetylase RimI-like enzyme
VKATSTLFAIQWAGLVAQVEMFGVYAPQSTLIEHEDMVGSAVPSVDSSIVNASLSRDPHEPPHELVAIRGHFEDAGATKWGVWVAGDDERGAAAAREHGLHLDSTPAAMVAELDAVPAARAAEAVEPVDLATVGAVNDAAYGVAPPRFGPPISQLPDTVHTYGVRAQDGTIGAVAMAFDHGHEDTAVWFVATRPEAQRQGLGRAVLAALLADARARGNRTASLQSSPAGRRLYESLGFASVGEVHLYEERLSARAPSP